MEKRIELEMRGRPADEITDLNLDNCRATQIAGLTSDFKNLESLSLINVGLTTLKGFPSLPSLRKLELSDNRISGGLNALQSCPKLTHVNLSGNKIKDINTLEPLHSLLQQSLSDLKSLDLFNCEVTQIDEYREKVFELLKGLQFLDGYDRNNQEAEEDEDEDGDDVDGEEDDEEEDGDDGDSGSDDDEDDDDDDDDEGSDDEGDGVVDVGGEDDDDDDDDDDEEDGEEDDDEEDDEEEEGEEDGVGLAYLQKQGIEDDSEGDDFEPGEADESGELEEIDDDEDGEEDDDESRGVKRKHEDGDDDA